MTGFAHNPIEQRAGEVVFTTINPVGNHLLRSGKARFGEEVSLNDSQQIALTGLRLGD